MSTLCKHQLAVPRMQSDTAVPCVIDGDMIYRSGSAACDVAAEIMLQIDRSDPYIEDSLDDDAWRMPDDDLSEWHRASAEGSDEAMSDADD